MTITDVALLEEPGRRNGAILVGVDEAYGGVETERPEGQSEAESKGRDGCNWRCVV